jgi:uncharacterized protein YbjT (DUF2867 family)
VILVTGPTGNVGSRLVRHLAAAGVPTRAFVHRPESAPELQELGVETVVGAFEDADSLRRALDRIEQVYLVSPPGSDSLVRQQLPVVEAAREAGVRHVVKQSSIAAEEGSPPPIVAAHRQVEQAMEDSGMAWTHLRPHWFMQNELGQASTIAGDGIFYAPDVTQISMIDAADVASVAAAVLTSDGHAGQAYLLTGPEALSYTDVADTYSRVLGKDVRWQEVSLEDARDSMREAGMDDELAVGFPEIMDRYRAGGSARSLSPWVEQLTGRPPRTFEDFVREHRDTFAGS